MPLIDKFKKSTKASSEQSVEFVPVMEFFFHGSYLEEIDLEGAIIEYVPLTLAERIDNAGKCDVIDEEYVIRSIAKGFKVKFERGLENPDEFLISKDQSLYWNAERLVKSLNSTLRTQLIMSIQLNENTMLQGVRQLFDEHHEEYMEGDFNGIKREPNKLDYFLQFHYSFKDSPYKLEDVSQMTPVQYAAYTLTSREASVRSNNDQTAHSNKSAAASAAIKKKGTGKKIVGS